MPDVVAAVAERSLAGLVLLTSGRIRLVGRGVVDCGRRLPASLIICPFRGELLAVVIGRRRSTTCGGRCVCVIISSLALSLSSLSGVS